MNDSKITIVENRFQVTHYCNVETEENIQNKIKWINGWKNEIQKIIPECANIQMVVDKDGHHQLAVTVETTTENATVKAATDMRAAALYIGINILAMTEHMEKIIASHNDLKPYTEQSNSCENE